MPIIGKPLLVLGSLAGVSLLSAGGYFAASALDSQQAEQPITNVPNSGSGNSEEASNNNPVQQHQQEAIGEQQSPERSQNPAQENSGIPPAGGSDGGQGTQSREDVSHTEQQQAVTSVDSGVSSTGTTDTANSSGGDDTTRNEQISSPATGTGSNPDSHDVNEKAVTVPEAKGPDSTAASSSTEDGTSVGKEVKSEGSGVEGATGAGDSSTEGAKPGQVVETQ